MLADRWLEHLIETLENRKQRPCLMVSEVFDKWILSTAGKHPRSASAIVPVGISPLSIHLPTQKSGTRMIQRHQNHPFAVSCRYDGHIKRGEATSRNATVASDSLLLCADQTGGERGENIPEAGHSVRVAVDNTLRYASSTRPVSGASGAAGTFHHHGMRLVRHEPSSWIARCRAGLT